jgi:hypothetical protein
VRWWAELGHLAGRFRESLSQAEPPRVELAWLEAKLSAAEIAQIETMSVADRRHAVACGRRADVLRGAAVSDEMIAASALHDVGKTEARLGTFGRALATVVGKVTAPGRRESWSEQSGWRRAFAVYLDHDVRGAELLSSIGSAPLVVAWAREHHLDEAHWSIPPEWGRCLARADLELSYAPAPP